MKLTETRQVKNLKEFLSNRFRLGANDNKFLTDLFDFYSDSYPVIIKGIIFHIKCTSCMTFLFNIIGFR